VSPDRHAAQSIDANHSKYELHPFLIYPLVGEERHTLYSGCPTPVLTDWWVCKTKASHTRYRALGLELIPVYRQSACSWLYIVSKLNSVERLLNKSSNIVCSLHYVTSNIIKLSLLQSKFESKWLLKASVTIHESSLSESLSELHSSRPVDCVSWLTKSVLWEPACTASSLCACNSSAATMCW